MIRRRELAGYPRRSARVLVGCGGFGHIGLHLLGEERRNEDKRKCGSTESTNNAKHETSQVSSRAVVCAWKNICDRLWGIAAVRETKQVSVMRLTRNMTATDMGSVGRVLHPA